MLSLPSKRLAFGAWALCVGLACSCGARTELPIPEFDYCVTFNSEARPADLDLFLLIDSSESMAATTELNTVKWVEVTQAIEEFVTLPSLAGTGATITFFPERRSDVPSFCNNDNNCGEPGACISIGICMPDGGAACLEDVHCADQGLSGNTCEPLGQCAGSETFCLLDQQDDFCGGNPCVDVGVCTNRTVCDSDVYALPGPKVLPDAAPGIINAMDKRDLGGGTPTWPAVQGAIASAQNWVEQRPTHKAIVVLATDGMPSTCDPNIEPLFPEEYSVENVVTAVTDGAAAGIATFVIGVFAPDEADVAQTNLDTVAAAGSDSSAFIVTTNSDIEQQVLEALLQVRQSATTCVYALDFARAHEDNSYTVTVARGDTTLLLEPVIGAQGCAAGDGFYFDPVPAEDASRAQIVLCPSSCAAVEGKPDRVRLDATCPPPPEEPEEDAAEGQP